VAGATGGGGGAAGEQAEGGGQPNVPGGGGTNVAESGRAAGGELPFTGLHAPLLVLIGLGMAGGGFALRRRLAKSA
jgi:hypothetical protein